MKVFISWSGETSKAIALVLRRYLPVMIQQIKPFMSKHDIVTGTRWAQRIQEELEESSYGLIVLTPSNLRAPWILFEAGAISKLKNSATACLLCADLQPAEVPSPLGQFQCQPFSQEQFGQLIRDMNFLTRDPLPDESLTSILDKFWPDIESGYSQAIGTYWTNEKTKLPPRDDREFQDEILLTLRNLAQRQSSPGKKHAGEKEEWLYRFSILKAEHSHQLVTSALRLSRITNYRARDGVNRIFYECSANEEQWINLRTLIGDKIRVD